MDKNNIKNKILILGAAGFIGKNLCRRLISDGQNIKCLDLSEVELSNLKELVGNEYVHNIELIKGSLSDFGNSSFADDILSDVSIVYHLVSTTCPTNSNQDVFIEMQNNVMATIRLMDACVRNNIKRIVFLSSGGTVYGKEHDGILSETDDTNPISSYGIQKLSIEKLLYLYNQMFDLDYRVVRLSNPYGPYQRPNGVQGVVSTFSWKALMGEPIVVYGDGSVIRDYIYIDDAITGIINIASDKAKFKLYNLGSGIGTSVTQVIDTIRKIISNEISVEYKEGRKVDVPVNILNVSRYVSEFGPSTNIDLNQGIERLLNFYKEL